MPRKILRLIEFRLIVGFSLLLSFLIIQLAILYLFPYLFFFSFLALLFALSIVYLILYRLNIREKVQLGVQILGDWVLISFLILNTGGYKSSLYFVFVFLVVEAFLFFNRRGIMWVSLFPLLTYLMFSFTSFYFKYPNVDFDYQVFTTNLLSYGIGFPLLGYIMASSRDRIKALTMKIYYRESLLSLFRKIDDLFAGTIGSCFLLIDSGRIVIKGQNCRRFPVDELYDKAGEISISGRIYNVMRAKMDDMEMVVIADITQRELRTKREGMREAASILSHELKNPLASILGAVQVFNMMEKGEGRERILQIIKENAERIKSILSEWDRIELREGKKERLVEVVKSILEVEDGHWKINEEKDGKIIIRREPPLSAEEIDIIMSPNLKNIETGKGLLMLEFTRLLSSFNAKMEVSSEEIRITVRKDGKNIDN